MQLGFVAQQRRHCLGRSPRVKSMNGARKWSFTNQFETGRRGIINSRLRANDLRLGRVVRLHECPDESDCPLRLSETSCGAELVATVQKPDFCSGNDVILVSNDNVRLSKIQLKLEEHSM